MGGTGSFQLTVTPPPIIPNPFFVPTPGVLSGRGEFQNLGEFRWSGGQIIDLARFRNTPSGRVTIEGNINELLQGGVLRNEPGGVIVWQGANDILMSSTASLLPPFLRIARIENAGTFQIQNDRRIAALGNVQFVVFDNLGGTGVFQKVAGTGLTTVAVPFDNKGSIDLRNATKVVFQGPLLDDGIITVSGGSELTVAGPLTQGRRSETTITASTMIVQGAYQLTGRATITLQLGAVLRVGDSLTIGTVAVLQGSGTIEGDVVNHGYLYVGGKNSLGTLVINGNFTQAADGELIVDVTGQSPGQADQLVVLHAVFLSGQLTINDPFARLKAGDSFEIITTPTGEIVGTFRRVVSVQGLAWNVEVLLTAEEGAVLISVK